MKTQFQKRLAILSTSAILITSTYAPIMASDYQNHWAKEVIDKWKDKRVINGYEDGTFKPKQTITRAELAKIIVEIFGLSNTSNAVEYTDVSESTWYAPYVKIISSAGIMNDYGTDFKPNQIATREEAAYVIANAYKITNGKANFKDMTQISEWAYESVGALAFNGYINGRPDKTFAPNDSLTRADVITMIDKITADLINKPGIYSQNIEGNLVVNSGDVILKDMTINGNLYIAEGVGEGSVILNNIKVNGTIYLQGTGENSFKVINGSQLSHVEVLRANNKPVHIYLDKGCSIDKLDVISECILEGEGNFNIVNVNGKVEVEIKGITVKTLNVKAKITLNTSSHSKIINLVCDEVVKFMGSGKVDECILNVSDCKFETVPEKIIFINDSIKVYIGSREYTQSSIDSVSKVSSDSNSSVSDDDTFSDNYYPVKPVIPDSSTTTSEGLKPEIENDLEYNKNRLRIFFEEYGIEIPNNDDSWKFFMTAGGGSHGEPDEWGDNGVVFVSKDGMKDNIPYEQYRYAYCPALNEGVLIISENNYLKIIKYYKNGEVISKGELPDFEEDKVV